jgi:hypothetical protein
MADVEDLVKRLADQQGEIEDLVVNSTRISLKPPSGSNYLKAVEIGSGNALLITLTEALLCVVKVNGEAVSPVTSRAKLDALSDRLTRDGVEAVQLWHQEKTNPEIMEVVNEKLALGESIDTQDPALGLEIINRRKAKVKNLQKTQ